MSFENKYPYTDFHELNLDWFLSQFKILMNNWDSLKSDNEEFKSTMTTNFETLEGTVETFTTFVTNYFENLDVQQEVNNKLDEMAEDGTLSDLIQPLFDEYKAQIDGIIDDITDELALGFDNTGKWLFLGDSYEFNGGGWITNVCTYLGLTLGTNAFNAAVSGHGFSALGGKWINDFNSFISGRTDLDEFKHVVVCGGLNDSEPAVLGNVETDIASFCSAVKTNMKNAVVSIGYIGSALSDSPVLADRGAYNRQLAIDHYNNAIPASGAIKLHNTEYIMSSYTFFGSDKLHPNSYGAAAISKGIAEAIISSSCDTLYKQKASSATIGVLTAFSGYESTVNNGMFVLKFVDVLGPKSGSNTLSFGDFWTTIGTVPNGVFQNDVPEQDITVQLTDASTSVNYLCKIKIEARSLKMKCYDLATTSGYKTFTYDSSTNRLDLGTITFVGNTLDTM